MVPLRLCFGILILFLTLCGSAQVPDRKRQQPKIQLALLVDISGSMDALLNQTKSQFWNTANYLSSAAKQGEKPVVEIALITYGGALDSASQHCRVLTDLTADLDSVAEHLDRIKIGGSYEFCWGAIDHALDKFNWSSQKNDLKLIVIAGNESFNQGRFDPDRIIQKAKKENVMINTIFCSRKDDAEYLSWSNAAKLFSGEFSMIDIQDTIRSKETDMDSKLIEFNDKLNGTYIPYGDDGKIYFERMLKQDRSTKLLGISFFRDRIYYKVSPAFRNPAWDLIDAVDMDSSFLEKIDTLALPKTIRNLAPAQLLEFIRDTQHRRNDYQDAIRMRYERLMKYLGPAKKGLTIDDSIKKILEEQGRRKGFFFSRE